MVRLYFDGKFEPGLRVRLDEAELLYWRSVKRSQGTVQLFNSDGEWATGEWAGKEFIISDVSEAPFQGLPVTVALALPDRAVIGEIIPMLSEIGVEKLILFPSARSQSSLSKIASGSERWQRLAIESARQCLRAKPLQIETKTWEDLLQCSDSLRLCFSEIDFDGKAIEAKNLTPGGEKLGPVLCVFGCEGGWTAEEIAAFKKSGFSFCHLKIPVMKVATAVTTCLGCLIATFFQDRIKWSIGSLLRVDP